MANYYIGIDPDVEKCGYAIWNAYAKELYYNAFSFWYIIDTLIDTLKDDVLTSDYHVLIEAGWLNKKHNYHNAQNKVVGERIAHNVGRNHQVGILLAEFCERNGLKYTLVKPSKKKWTPAVCKKITGHDIKNQDIIDAVKLVFGR